MGEFSGSAWEPRRPGGMNTAKMMRKNKPAGTCLLALMFVATFFLPGFAQQNKELKIRVLIVGFADRFYDVPRGWARSREFLAIRLGQKEAPDEFIKLELQYYPQDKEDPRQLAERSSREMTFDATREVACDESFAGLSRRGIVSLFDPDNKPSRFVILRRAPQKRPLAEAILPCYQVKKF
jgi:hypothetical protein